MTGALVATLSVALAAVLAVAGLTKLVDRAGSREAARNFGSGDRFAGVVATGVPLAELGIALLLLPSATRWWAAVAAVALFLAFSITIARVMARGEAPECHCFGQLHSRPVGWRTLMRNGVLIVCGLAVVLAGRNEPGPSAFAWASRLDGVGWLTVALAVSLLAVATVGGYAVVHVLRSYGRVLESLETVETRLREAGFDLNEVTPELGLPPGTPAPAFWLPGIDGGRIALGDLMEPDRPLLLLFTSPSCGPCSVLMPDVARWQHEHVRELTIAVLSEGEIDRVHAEAAAHGLVNVLVDENLATYEAYAANGTPSAVLVGTDGLIASHVASGADWIASLVEEALGGLGRPAGLPIGADAPAIELDTLDGARASVTALVDGPTVVLFWNPDCGYCRSLHTDVRAWEDAPPERAPSLVVVSAGEVDDVRNEGFASPVLLDAGWELAGAFGADGTPMATLIDGAGEIASPLVSGSEDVLALLAGRSVGPELQRIAAGVNDKEGIR